ncbi:MAG: AMP-binding protein [Gordonia sp. (in: high G+C Gram-positive bacteria)]|uniref:class I adenylate-forming enzyme family protein n=1 Tax=Gordonia sp. (in: high G+C Gram-positive bacteria) TaxID=84139 RepID=UPI0039E2EB09
MYDEFERRLPGVRLAQSYSLTEGGVVGTTLDHDDARGRERSVGRANPLTEVKVAGSDGDPRAPGEIGEVWLRSPGVGGHYWNRPEATAETFVDGWCRTGDLGWMDADGFLTLTGRAKDMIRSGGENVSPAEVEKVIALCPDVGAVAVIGVPDTRYVEVGCAVLEPRGDEPINLDEVRRLCRERLAGFKVPRHYVVVDRIPRNASGKIRKSVLRETYRSLAE